jgi:chemotaxis protein MotB
MNNRGLLRRIKNNSAVEYQSGMWKIAYADFITALMAFFLLLWVLNSAPKENLQGVAEYFSSFNIKEKSGIGFEDGINKTKAKGILFDDDSSNSFSEVDIANFQSLISSIKTDTDIANFADNILIDTTEDGLRIQIVDSDDRPMFRPNTDEIQLYMIKIITEIGKLIEHLPNNISVIGHTASIKKVGDNNIDLWKLSINRAIKVKDFLAKIVKPSQIVSLTGKADTEHLNASVPYSSRNIRISLIVLKNNYKKN